MVSLVTLQKPETPTFILNCCLKDGGNGCKIELYLDQFFVEVMYKDFKKIRYISFVLEGCIVFEVLIVRKPGV